MTISELLHESNQMAISKGWWDLPIKNGEVRDRNFGELIALAHSELSEALEEVRSYHPLDEIYYSATTAGPRSLSKNSHCTRKLKERLRSCLRQVRSSIRGCC
jgi:hypothetical protein